MKEEVRLRVHGDESLPTLIYLPGLHGNWTLIGGFRQALKGRARLVETTYPPTTTWSLDDYAESVEEGLAKLGITSGWLLGESFSSQVVWELVRRNRFRAQGLVFAGGFVRHPMRGMIGIVEKVFGELSLSLITRILFGYAFVARWRFRKSPETQQAIQEFIAGLNENEKQAAKHRLMLIARNDPRVIASQVKLPVYAVTGFFDPVVPWYWVRRWLKRNCGSLREYRVIFRADHNVLGTGTDRAAAQILKWLSS